MSWTTWPWDTPDHAEQSEDPPFDYVIELRGADGTRGETWGVTREFLDDVPSQVVVDMLQRAATRVDDRGANGD